jgi:hypothetical protein
VTRIFDKWNYAYPAWLLFAESFICSRDCTPPTDRLSPFESLGKGRRQATDGPAWSAAIAAGLNGDEGMTVLTSGEVRFTLKRDSTTLPADNCHIFEHVAVLKLILMNELSFLLYGSGQYSLRISLFFEGLEDQEYKEGRITYLIKALKCLESDEIKEEEETVA